MDSLPAIEQDPDGGTTVSFDGGLTDEVARAQWTRATGAANDATGPLTIELSGVSACDGVGLGLLIEMQRLAESRGGEVRFRGASAELQELISMARLAPGEPEPPPVRGGLLISVGNASAFTLGTLKALIAFTGMLAAALPVAIASLSRPRIREILAICGRVGADAVPVVSFLGFLIGFILSVQAVKALESIGTTSLVPMVVGFATFREFGPLIAGIILAGRSGAAFAAEIGTMKITEELDAYTTFGLDPMVILVFPRILAGILVMPLLTLFSIALSVVGGVLPMFKHDYTFWAYVDAVFASVAPADLVQALTKGLVFGFLFAAMGCFHGLRTRSGADAVGVSTTRAVVWGIVAILVADSILSTIFYNLGY